ncbi:hypothetical protein JCM11957_00040 [Caminibacter profundus]
MKSKIKANSIEIVEPIITIKDSEEIISNIEKIANEYNSIIIHIKNSFSFPSSIIATLEKLKDEGKDIKIIIKDDIIYELFKDLNLDKMFNIAKE